MAGAAGVPFLAGQHARGPEQRRSVLSGDAARRSSCAEQSITIEAYIYWAGEIGLTFAKALAAAAAARRQGQDPARCRRLAEHRQRDPEDPRGRRLPRRVVQPDSHHAAAPHQQPHAPQVADHRRPHRLHRRRRHRRPLDRRRAGRQALARSADSHRGPGGAAAADRLRAELARVHGRARHRPAISIPPLTPVGPLSLQTIMSSPETGASTVRVMYLPGDLRGAEDHRHRQSVLRARSRLDRFVPRCREARRPRARHGGRHQQRHAGHAAEQRAALRRAARCRRASVYEYNRTMMHHKIMIVDGLWSTVGTTNFDNRSFSHNEENNVCVCDAGVAAELHADVRARPRGVRRASRSKTWQRRGRAAQDRRGARLVRAGPGLDSEFPKSEDLAEEVPEPLVDLADRRTVDPSRSPRRGASTTRMSVSKSLVNAPPAPRSKTPTVSSSFNSNERLPKLAEPMMLKMPSTISALVCIIVGWYSKISKPWSSRSW